MLKIFLVTAAIAAAWYFFGEQLSRLFFHIIDTLGALVVRR
jgi:hypothetical protein